MSSGYVFALAGAVVTLAIMVEMLRRRRLREKYAALWMVVAVVVLVAAIFPAVPTWIAGAVGITVPVNLVFFLGLLVLLIVCVQLSAEVSDLEQETQTLALESAVLRNRLERLEQKLAAGDGDGFLGGDGGHGAPADDGVRGSDEGRPGDALGTTG